MLRTLVAALLLAVAVPGCGDDADTDRQRQEMDGATDDPMRTGDNGVVSADPNEAPNAVEVRLKEFEVRMPTILKPGSHLFKVTNDGTEPHGLTVEGNGTTASLSANAQPGETQTLPVDLAPGSYRVYCPVDGHADRGMVANVTVSE
jgi:plastocyanin